MRLLQCGFPEINDYSWARGSEDYRETYKNQLAEADKEIATRAATLQGLQLDPDQHKNKKITGLLLTERQVLDLAIAGTPCTIERVIPIEDSLEGELIKFRTVVEKLHAIPSHERSYNNKVEVHMPGQALSTYNDLLLAEDICTDALQEHLNTGWRILAVCPQPDQRRPDYILGRFNPQISVGGKGAERN